jgi:HAE1 family hydrophobic/amphiphilic exporter-1
VRPILMTAIATILALIPLAAGLSEGSIIAAELGTVVIGGLFSSTFLTLLVIPVLYSLVDGGKSGLARRFGRAEPAASDAAAVDPGAMAPPAQPAPAG